MLSKPWREDVTTRTWLVTVSSVLALAGCASEKNQASASTPSDTTPVKAAPLSDPIAFFDKKSISYTYQNNGWAFTNVFEGDTRITDVPKRGVLREKVTITEVGERVFMIAWEDEFMGPISQVIDVKQERMWAAVRWEGEMQIWPGKITSFVDADLAPSPAPQTPD